MPRAAWTTREDIVSHLRKLWDRGDILSSYVTGRDIFPLSIPVKGPSSREFSERFDEARRWVASLMEGAKSGRYSVELFSVNHRVLGRNDLPAKVWIEDRIDALSLLRVGGESAAFRGMIEVAENECPPLLAYLERYPIQALSYAEDWERIIDTVVWVMRHPKPGVYLRQIDARGVDTKFIERRRGVFARLLDMVLPQDAVDHGFSGSDEFARRYGFLKPPTLIRFRPPIGCEAFPDCVSDLSLPADEFARLDLGFSDAIKVLVTENLINFLSIPRTDDSILIWGAGYSFDEMASAHWMKPLEIFYWGDIDTHGFAILSQFRGYFPQARSFLMDYDTLIRHKELWVEEPKPAAHELKNLTDDEAAVYDTLRHNKFGERVRLEQERLSYSWVERALREI
ncbi:MAG: DUF3322 domain-containing protein [Synergistaceae bacterium]|jgi:hypothetical protein|nr:DUF3322 domain-containing protein [Synergistaceae bacterium]